MESSIGKLVYCCVSNHSRILYAYNGGDRDLETLASLCVERAPPFHSHYFHTAGGRTFGFLIDGALVSFAIVDHHSAASASASASNKPKLLHLLCQIKNGYKKSSNNFGDDLVPIIKRLICSLESMNHDNSNACESSSSSSSTKAPLLAGNNGVERKNSVKIDVAGAESGPSGGGSSADMNATFPSRNRQVGRKLWWRNVKIIVIADVFLCLVLFGIWLAVCRGFRCVS